MRDFDRDDEKRQSLWASLFLLCFGVGTLVYLTAIERQNWFHIRPASGTAAAMYQASDQAKEER